MDEKYKIIQEEPVDFIELAFKESLWSKQQDIVNAVRDNQAVTVRSCFDIGKSFISARIALWFLYAFYNSKVITTAPTFRQVKDILWRELHVAKSKAIVPLGGTLNDTSLDVADNWFAIGFSSDKPTNFQGFHSDTGSVLVIVDEAAGVPNDVYNSIEGLLTSENSRLLLIGNPTSTDGQFYRSHRMPGYAKIAISAFDTPNFTAYGITMDDIRSGEWKTKITGVLPSPYLVTPNWVADKLIRWGEDSPMFQALVQGEFPLQGNDILIPLAKIEEARNRTITPLETDPHRIGADFAAFGDDKSEYGYRHGGKVLDWKTYSKIDTVFNAGELSTFMGFHPFAVTNCDDGGLGMGIVDMVQQNNPLKEVNGVNSSSEPQDKENFYNLRAEMFWGLRDRFISGDIDLSELPPEVYEDLAAQLSNIKYKYTPRGQRQIESKEDMRKRGLPSPDKADTLALMFANIAEKPGLVAYLEAFKM